ncbi:MAG: DUF1330 domain-containing protein [Actinomycetia bacterium]|nr:DUF1330 domain-containing protein [Actinomycetes bacterium]MCP4224917.1 DUF1330 domain-containing protein [Actinomycetes bacterium]MCP5033418.1 DUF1330 domain-containing protein [Actinomycetes bacterium]
MAGYFVLHTRWHTLDRLDEYQRGAQTSLAEYGAKSLVYDVRPEVVEGESNLAATVILEFADLETAKAWYNSPGYQAVLGIRLQASEGIGRFVTNDDVRTSEA